MAPGQTSKLVVSSPRRVWFTPLWSIALLALLCVAPIPSAAARQPAWSRQQLSPRYAPAMAYDSARGVAVLFGGYSDTYSNETWERLSNAGGAGEWIQRGVGEGQAPAARRWHAMTYDSARGVTIMFGGQSAAGQLSDTWEWDGDNGADGTWTLRTANGAVAPSPRDSHAMAYDSARGIVVLFGGVSAGGVGSGETWEWNGSNGGTWTLRQAAGPSPRWGHRLAYDAARGVTMLFGGFNGTTYLGDTWEWNGSTWTQRLVPGPSPRYAPSLAYDQTRNSIVLFGGYNENPGGFSNETWEWNGNGPGVWTPRLISGPAGRSNHAAIFDSTRGSVVIFGGTTGAGVFSNETWEWNGNGVGSWSERSIAGPGARQRHAIAYDSFRQVTVLFGGFSGSSGFIGDTWEWNGVNWRNRPIEGPSPRQQHAMAYDAARGVVVLFGGLTGAGLSNETWEWDGGFRWIRRTFSGPSPRADAAMVYDSIRGVTVLFGGNTGTENSNETWEWDGTNWSLRAPTGDSPYPRQLHGMAFDSQRGVTVLYGGVTELGSASDTWEWDGTTWTDFPVLGPPPRWGLRMAFDDTTGMTVLFGGYLYDNGDTWLWSGTSWAFRPSVGGIRVRDSHAMAFDSTRHVVVLFGGLTEGGTYNNETWEWNSSDGGAWSQRVVAGPTPRFAAAMTYDEQQGNSLVFGGFSTIYSNETWTWNAVTGEGWTRHDVRGPSPRFHHAMAYDRARGATLLFGGFAQDTGFNDETWEWNGFAWTDRTMGGPPARYGHALAYDSTRHVAVLFGGQTLTGLSGETWEWNGTALGTWTRIMADGPPPLRFHSMAYDEGRGVSILFGGEDESGAVNAETWEWNGTAWTQRLVSGPSPRRLHAAVYDDTNGVMILFGGASDLPALLNAETWRYDGHGAGSWNRMTISGPSARQGHTMSYDRVKRATLLAGGTTSGATYAGEVWELGVPCIEAAITSNPNPRTTCPGGSASFAISATGSGQVSFQWRKNGVNLSDSPNHISGSTTPILSIVNAQASDVGAYDCHIENSCGTANSNVANLNVCRADFNCDSFANSADFFDFLSAFFTNSPSADYTGDGFINSQDFFDFLAAFFTGC